jgi:hypothetical protein
LDTSAPGILKIIFLAVSLSVAPFLGAEGTSDSGNLSKIHSPICVFSDYSGTLYLDRQKSGELQASADDPFKIFAPPLGSHLLQQRIPDGEIINCYVSVINQQNVFVYLHLGHSKVVYYSADENYQVQTNHKNWHLTWAYIGGGVLVIAIVALVILISSSPSTQEGLHCTFGCG